MKQRSRNIRILTITAWVVALVVVLGLVFVHAAAPPATVTTTGGPLPVVYEFTTDT